MRVGEIARILDAEILTGFEYDNIQVYSACGADLMSDVMAFVKENNVVMLTGLVNPQVIRTAEVMDISVIVFVRGKSPDPGMIQMAEEKGIVLARTNEPMFISCGKLYSAGISGRGVCD